MLHGDAQIYLLLSRLNIVILDQCPDDFPHVVLVS